MINSTKKLGRPQTEYRASWGDKIQGLTRLADKRWKVSGPPIIKFTEADERLAVARFYELRAKQQGRSSEVIPMATIDQDGNFIGTLPPTSPNASKLGGTFLPSGTSSVPAEEFTNRIVLNGDVLEFQGHPVNTDMLFAWFRGQIIKRPKWVAERVGIEQIGYLTNIMPPKPSPRLDELIDLYVTKPGLSHAEANRAKLFWKDFTKATGATTVREIDHDAVIRYEKKVLAGGFSPKYIHHQYGGIRTILSYAIKRGTAIVDCRHALDCTILLEIKNHTPLDPKPITPADFWAIHAQAIKAQDDTFATLMLTALNMAAYGGEVSALRWDEINMATGEVVTRRPKTGVSRVAVLWPETLVGLKKLPRLRDQVFMSVRRSYTTNTVIKLWKKYRAAAELPADLKFSQLRDAAFTVANNVSLDQARVLAGHRIGMADHYIRRAPQFVAPACMAIRAAFFPPTKPTKH